MSSTILVADDDRAIRMVLNQALARLGHDVRMTGNAATLWRWVSDGGASYALRRAERESFASGLLEPPQYTRPEEFRGARVPDVLLSGAHARIARWRRTQALWLTWRRRPDLLAQAELDAGDRRLIERFERGETPSSNEAP